MALADRLTLVALIVALTVVIGRSTFVEASRERIDPSSQGQPAPREAGVTSGLVCDLIAGAAALIALAARAARPGEVNRSSLACVLGTLLGVWAAASFLWADDKFAAIVHAADLLAAMCVIWTAAQCVTTSTRLRLVAAAAFGLLLLNLVYGTQWRLLDMPQAVRLFEQQKDKFLHDKGWKPGSFMALQFERKILHMEVLGFTTSANSFAAVLVLLGGVCVGWIIQLWRDGARVRGMIVAAAIPATGVMLALTQSKAAVATPLLIALILWLVWRKGTFLHRRPGMAYAIGAAIVIAAMACGLAWGLTFHSLPGASLNFRWRYWTAAWQMFLDHPWLGVGWSNFGAHYLHYRLPIAAEEIQDPHNFLIRFLTETGLIGAMLAAAWTARLWWELTRNSEPAAEERVVASGAPLALAVVGGMLLNLLASADFSQSQAYIIVQLCNRIAWFGALSIGAWLVCRRMDHRPAPWLLYAMLAALAAFMAHNLIEFSFFEPGPMLLFALLAGSALGMRRRIGTTSAPRATAWLVAAGAAWIGAASLVVIVAMAESHADAGDNEMRAAQFTQATADYSLAFDLCGFNADYLNRAAGAAAYVRGANPATVLDMMRDASRVNPSAVSYDLDRARLEARLRDANGMRADFDAALALNPNEVSIRLEYADALTQLGLPDQAAAQVRLALKFNDLLGADEPKRMDDAAILAHLPPATGAQQH